MQSDAAELGCVGPFVLLVGAGRAPQIAKGQIPARLLGVHGPEDLFLVPHQTIQLVFHTAGGVGAGGAFGSRIGQQVEHARRFGPGKAAAGVPRQAEQIQQHLAVQPAVDLFQVQLFGAGLVIHHPHPAGAVLFHPLVGPVHRTDELDRPPIRQMIELGRHGVLAPADLQLTGHRPEAGLALLVPQVAQKACHALFQPGEQIGEAGGVFGQVAAGVLVHQQPRQLGHCLVVQLDERRQHVGAGVVRRGVRVQRHL